MVHPCQALGRERCVLGVIVTTISQERADFLPLLPPDTALSCSAQRKVKFPVARPADRTLPVALAGRGQGVQRGWRLPAGGSQGVAGGTVTLRLLGTTLHPQRRPSFGALFHFLH